MRTLVLLDDCVRSGSDPRRCPATPLALLTGVNISEHAVCLASQAPSPSRTLPRNRDCDEVRLS